MKKMGPAQARLLKIVHLFFVVMWVGGGISLTTVMFIAASPLPEDIYMKFLSMKIIDDFIIIPGALGSLFTGLVYSIWTKWGFFRHNWLKVKWAMTVLQILFGTFALGPWLNGNTEIAGVMRGAVFSNPYFLRNTDMIKVWGPLQVLLLVMLIAVSVIKPWKSVKS